MPSILTRPSGGGGDSKGVSVALSASTIEYGQTLTITATPTGLTPTNYFGFTKSAINSLTYIGEQASNVFNWAVDSPAGANTLFVQADDGSDGVFNVGGEAFTVTTNYLLNYTDFLACWSTIKRGQTFSDPILRALRSSDSDEADFTPVTGTPEVFDGSATASNAIPATHDGDTFTTFISSDNGTTPNVYDQAGGNYDGSQSTLNQQPTIATGGTIETVDGFPVYSFDGSNDNVAVFDNEVVPAAWQGLSDAITIIAWVSPDAFGSVSSFWRPSNVLCELRVIAADSSVKVPFCFGFTSAKIACGFTDNYTTNAEVLETDAVMTTGELQQVAVTIDGDTVKFYRNGELLSQQTITTATGDRSVGTSNSTLRIGARSTDTNSPASYYAGDVTDIIIADSVLSDDDILNIYNFYQS